MEKFSIVVLPKSPASRAIAQLQPIVRQKLWHALNQFAANPTALSESGGHLGRGAGQLFRFQIDVEDSIYFFQLLFKFADTRDENTILVMDLHVRIA